MKLQKKQYCEVGVYAYASFKLTDILDMSVCDGCLY